MMLVPTLGAALGTITAKCLSGAAQWIAVLFSSIPRTN
jgi:hypothetical protein